MALIALRRYEEAVDSYTTALSIFTEIEGSAGSQIAVCLNFGCAYLAMTDYRRAVEHLQRTVSMDRRLYRDQHPDTARHLANLARAQLSMADSGSRAEGKRNLAQARQTLIRIVGRSHPDVHAIEQFERAAGL
jgi:tetratricopeptide (TPR) repeat protein